MRIFKISKNGCFWFIFSLLGLLSFSVQAQSDNELRFKSDTLSIGVPSLNEAQRVAFIESIHKKVWILQHYISQIADKSISIEEREEIAEEALKLFMDENNYVQVSSRNSDKVTQIPIRTYFYRLMNIDASQVEITFYEVSKLTDLKEGNDGYFYGTAFIYQDTKIYRDAKPNPAYYDKTIKKVDTRARLHRSQIPGNKALMMDVKFGNIKVVETK
jgi:hypothetical protein